MKVIGAVRAIPRRMRGAGRTGAVAVAFPLLVAAAVAVVGPAGSAMASSTTRLQDVSTLFCLDSNGNGNVYTDGCNGGNYQNWTLKAVAGYTSDYNIVDAQTGRCLDSNASGQAYTLPCNGGNYQNWHMNPATGTPNTFQDVSTGFCLDSNTSGQVYTLPCNGGNFQSWKQF